MNPQESSPEKGDLQNLSTGSGDSNPPSGKPDEKLGTSNFVELLGEEESYYIDKTGLVEAFFGCKRSRMLVTGPRRFGKTINLIMLKYFFELQVKVEGGQELSEETLWEKVQSTENYKLFHDHNLSITSNDYLMKNHFGRYPVICISFKCTLQITSYDEAISFCESVICDAFKKFICIESSLDDYDRTIYNKWCREEWNVKVVYDKIKVLMGLQTLAKYVCNHFGRQVVLLVDEYDAVIVQAMLEIESVKELKGIIQDCTSIITNAVKENPSENWVRYAFITGISQIAGMGMSGSNVKPFTFLDKHCFVPYYGLTSEEVKGLLEQTYKLDAQEIKVVENRFNGYCSKGGLKMYNIWSVLEFAGKRDKTEAIYEWQDTGMIVGLKDAFRFPEIKNIIETLLNDKDVDIGKVICCMTVENILDLVRVIRKFDPENIKYSQPNLFLSFILEQGYLSYVHKKPGHIVIPNEQIKEKIREKLTLFNNEVFGVNQHVICLCKEFFIQICNEVCDDKVFKKFHQNLEKYIQLYATVWVTNTEENVRCAVSGLFSDLGFEVGSHTYFLDHKGTKRYLDYILINANFVMIIEFKYKESNRIAMDAIRDRNYCDVFLKKEIVRNDVKRFVLLGVNMDENRKVSIGYLQDSQQFDQAAYLP